MDAPNRSHLLPSCLYTLPVQKGQPYSGMICCCQHRHTQLHPYTFTLTLLGDIPAARVQGTGLCQARKRNKGGFPGLLVQCLSFRVSCSSPACSGMTQCCHQHTRELTHSCVTDRLSPVAEVKFHFPDRTASIASARQAWRQAANHRRAH